MEAAEQIKDALKLSLIHIYLEMGAGQEKKASGIAGTALSSLVISGLILAVIALVFLKPLLTLFCLLYTSR